MTASLRQIPTVLAAYLFGSATAGIERQGSNLDMGEKRSV